MVGYAGALEAKVDSEVRAPAVLEQGLDVVDLSPMHVLVKVTRGEPRPIVQLVAQQRELIRHWTAASWDMGGELPVQ